MSRTRKKKVDKMWHEIRGRIEIDQTENISFTCCESRPNILINKIPLHSQLLELADFKHDPGDEDCHTVEPVREWRIRFLIIDRPWCDEDDFEKFAADIICGNLMSDAITGCYSEWTCGTGTYDFVLDGKHSILTELASRIGKYVWIKFI